MIVVKKGELLQMDLQQIKVKLHLGKNILMGFMTWEGYNYEDAILLSEELLKKMYLLQFILKNMNQKQEIQSLDQKKLQEIFQMLVKMLLRILMKEELLE